MLRMRCACSIIWDATTLGMLLTTLFAAATSKDEAALAAAESDGYAWHDPTNSMLDRGTRGGSRTT